MRTTILTAVRLAVLTAVALAAWQAPSHAQTTLRWKLDKGETIHYTMVQKTTAKRMANDKPFESTVTQTFDTTWKVTDSTGDTAEVTQTIDRVRISIEAQKAKVEYDSDTGEMPGGLFGPTQGPVLNALVKASITFKINGRGDVTDVKLPDKVMEALKTMKQAGGNAEMSEEGLKKQVQESTFPLPAEALSAGKSWTYRTSVKPAPGGTMDFNNTYTYRGPVTMAGKRLEQIDVAVQIAVTNAPDAPVQTTIKSQDGHGTFYFDNDKGYLDSKKVEQRLEMETKAGGQSFTQVVDTILTMSQGKPAQ